jgi:hypothetical protein
MSSKQPNPKQRDVLVD